MGWHPWLLITARIRVIGVNLDQGKQNSSSERKIRVIQCRVTEPNKSD